jgi:outer membrane autotransporter protein
VGGLNTYTGKINSTQLSAGGYYTRYAEDASYLDLVGQISSIENKFSDIYNIAATQKGIGLALSVEIGKPFALGDGQSRWFLEPQAQLSYQHNSYKAFSDSVSNISALTSDSLRARVGARLFWREADAKTNSAVKNAQGSDFYLTANLVTDLIQPSSQTIGGTTVSEDMNSNPWLELGVGGQLALSESTKLYGNVNYQRSLSSAKTRSGASGNVGVRISW